MHTFIYLSQPASEVLRLGRQTLQKSTKVDEDVSTEWRFWAGLHRPPHGLSPSTQLTAAASSQVAEHVHNFWMLNQRDLVFVL